MFILRRLHEASIFIFSAPLVFTLIRKPCIPLLVYSPISMIEKEHLSTVCIEKQLYLLPLQCHAGSAKAAIGMLINIQV